MIKEAMIEETMTEKRYNSLLKKLEWIGRVGVFGTFLGHGIFAYGVKPNWIPYLTCVGFSYEQAVFLMPLIGVLDIIIAFIVLLYPVRFILAWAAFWAFATAMMRPVSGEPFLDFVERAANWCLPLLLLVFLQKSSYRLSISDIKKHFFETK